MATFEILATLAKDLPEGKRENALALLQDMQTVVMGVDDSDKHWRAPIFRIIQAMTDTDSIDGANKAPGRLVVGSTAIPGEKLSVHVLRAWDSRKMWDPDVAVTRIHCNSPDAKTGWRYGDCKSCENAKWVDNTPAPCKAEKSFLVITDDFRNVVEMAFKSMHLAKGAEWQNNLKKSVKPPYLRVYDVASEKSAKKKGVFDPLITRTETFVEGAEEKFLEALFMFFRAKRTGEVEQFYSYLEQRRQKQAAAEEDDEGTPITIRASSAASETVEGEDAELPNYTL